MWPRLLFFASTRKACSALNPVRSSRVWIIWVHLKKATHHQVSWGSLAHFRDSYKRVKSLKSTRTALAALSPTIEFCFVAISIARNIKDRNVGKSNNRRVGRCRGFIEIVPVAGSIIIFCSPESEPEMTKPFEEPGAAMYGSLFGLGVFSVMVMGWNLAESRHFFTRISS